ncbi:Cof-type HAD-IIB family hydrolase [Candidatus Stoquefichus sp. SB1]|uniref:Cof-type HAD-IIB family hydrolase n=1 Tax=Candidatus Stoquefichus sp. SB1 TaxID=1658109 RepID=UPI00067E763B|nr:Cof-type HAD-IIB family hydrolase [Candidatus Stoquefichus sp. SB1]
MKTLYVSDLDGTLLRSDERTSDYTNQIINECVKKGMLFSYATARSYHTSQKVTKGLNAKIPLIVYNGVFIKDNVTGEIIKAHYFSEDIKLLIDELLENHIYPIVYAYIDNQEKFSFVEEKSSQGIMNFVMTRSGDSRMNPILEQGLLYEGNIFYITCIDDYEKLLPFYKKYQDQYHCVFQKDIYTQEQWLEFMPKSASKANAVQQLKEYYQCDHVVVFGDGYNDQDMFQIADECYAVSNAVEELKQMATDVIGHHDEDGVAKWLKQHTILDKEGLLNDI